MMKTKWLLIGLIVLQVPQLQAQKFDLSFTGIYQFGGAMDQTEQEGGEFFPGDALGINGSTGFGVAFNVRLLPKMKMTLSWDRQNTELNYHDYNERVDETTIRKLSDMAVEYYLAGLLYDWSRSNLQPFIGASVGVVRMVPSEKDIGSESKFAFSPIVGIRTYASSMFAIQFHARLILSNMNKGEYFHTTSGGGYEHEKNTFMSQYQLGIGFVFTF